MEIVALPPFTDISFEEFSREAGSDLLELQIRFKELGSKFTSRNESTVVYPSGNAHQFMPATWAQQHLSDALFVFHRNDPQAYAFEKSGLKVEKFASLDELLQSGFGARRIICTDSFPSHFWQVYATGVLLLQTIQISSYVVHPGFPRSQVIVSRAPCCPCLHITRGLQNAPCAKGYSTCLTWNDPDYAAALSQASIGLI